MKKRIVIALFCSLTFFGCEKEFLETPPKDLLTDETYWTREENVRTFAYGFYPAYFTGYGSGNTWGNYFTGQSLNDDFAPFIPTEYTKNVPTSSTAWTFSWVRKANLFIDRVQTVPMPEEAIAHWTGVGRFFRGMEYYDLVRRYGDVPWYGEVLTETDVEQLYKPRDPRTLVMDSVLADFKYAVESVRLEDGAKKQTVNKDVVLAYMSRVFLFEGTWQKYHANNAAKAAEYLEAAKWAAEQVISSGRYSLGNYREVFSSLSLTTNPEVILFREYESGVLTHALMHYNNNEPQTGPSKDLIDSYLATDGLPVKISPLYKGDHGIENVMANRDERITETFVSDELRLNGIAGNYSTTGYATHKFLNESIKDKPEGSLSYNPTDAPVIRYGEVLINYAEAAAELATVGGPAFTNEELNKSVNVLRSRPGVTVAPLQVAGDQPSAGGIVYDDPERDPAVSAVIWEIRRERRVELVFEGFRWDDLRRWKKLEYSDTQVNPDVNRGAWVDMASYPADKKPDVKLTETTKGYIIPSPSARIFAGDKLYLEPLPLDQIQLYKGYGADLAQNPGW